MEQLHVIFHGKVQGVWFRANCQRKAIELGLTGWVKNLPDGTVEAVIEGERGKLEEHLHWCKDHQSHARVTKVELDYRISPKKYSSFKIIR